VGRRHLSLVAALAVGAVLAAPASAGLRWRELARGATAGTPPARLVAVVALDRAGAKRLADRLPAAGRNALARLDIGRNVAIAILGEFGCKDHRIAVSSVERHGGALVVSLVERPLAPGTMECLAIYPTHRLLAVAKADLARPLPTAAEVRLARA
jgi:hypothetical protein